MNVLEVGRKDFVRASIELSSLKGSYRRVEFCQDFIYLSLRGGIFVLKDRYGYVGKGLFFAP